MPKRRKIKPAKWHICTEGVTEQNYLEGCLRALGLQGRIIINCGPKRESGCGKKHEPLLDQVQRCSVKGPYEQKWLLHDLDDGKIDPAEQKSFDDTFCRAWADADVKVVFFCPCFEYWLILHDQDYEMDSAQSQCQAKFQSIYEKRRKAQNRPVGEKDNYKTDPELFQLLGGLDGMNTAIKRAEDALRDPPDFAHPRGFTCSQHCPGTNFHILLKELLDLSEQAASEE